MISKNGLVNKACMVLFLAWLSLVFPTALWAQPLFSTQFSTSQIGAGNVVTLSFTIGNGGASPLLDLAFTDALPLNLVISEIPNIVNTCQGTVTAEAGGDTIIFSGDRLGGASFCSISVDVTSDVPGTYDNTTGELTSSQGTAAPASASLTVDSSLPGFRKSFSPDSIYYGQRSTLTFTIDNSGYSNFILNTSFTDTLPEGMIIADPVNLSSTCNATITAEPGGNVITFLSTLINGSSTCTVSLDVFGKSIGPLENVSGLLTSSLSGPSTTCGHASALLEVIDTPLGLVMDFPEDPVNPDTQTPLTFTVSNRNREFTAQNITFTDNLGAVMAGLTAVDTPIYDPCGSGSILTGSDNLSFSGGTLAPGTSCTFQVTVAVPSGAGGDYLNATSAVAGDVDGQPVAGNVASEHLYVQPGPEMVLKFNPTQAAAGDQVDLEFTVDNTDGAHMVSDIAFNAPFFSGATLNAINNGDCNGAWSQADVSGARNLLFMNGRINTGGSCSTSVTLDLASSLSTGTYQYAPGHISYTLDGASYTASSAPAPLTVYGPPLVQKSFTDDPVTPGEPVTLEYTIINRDAAYPVTGISFTDDLDSALSGLAATDLPKYDVCGAGSMISGGGHLTFSNGYLEAGESCTFSVTLQTPEAAESGSYTSTSSSISASTRGQSVTGSPVSDNLVISQVTMAMSFTDDPVYPGGTVNLQFVITNQSNNTPVTNISFQDYLDNVMTLLAPVSTAPVSNVCGSGSILSWGGNRLTLSDGLLDPLSSCTIDVPLKVPASANTGTYANTTTNFSGQIAGSLKTFPNASDQLEISADPLSFSKSFVDDPLPPGGTGILEYTITNQDSGHAITNLAFTDDLDAALSGLAATGLPVNDVCGIGSQINGSGFLSFTGGRLDPGDSCTIEVNILVPSEVATGEKTTSTTSALSGTLDSIAVSAPAASDDLVINHFGFSQSFAGSVIQGDSTTLNITIENKNTSGTVELLTFTDDLNGLLAGMAATNTPLAAVCGPDSMLSGTTVLTLGRGILGAGESCTFDVTVNVPYTAAPGGYTLTSSALTALGATLADGASAALTVEPKFFTISGKLTDSASGAAIPGASVYFSHDSSSTTTDANGEYTRSVQLGSNTIVTPAKAHYASWSPSNATYNNLLGDKTRNFVGTLETHDLTVSKAGSGSGTVTSSPAGVDCGDTCTATFPYGTTITLTAVPGVGDRFDGWSEEDCSGTGSCELALEEDTGITATFSPKPRADLSVTLGADTYSPGQGGPITFLVGVTNLGPAVATDVEVTDLLPEGLTYLSDNGGGTYHAGTGVWQVGDLAVGAAADLVINTRYDTENVVTNTAQSTHSESYDPVSGNDTASVTIDTEALSADVMVRKLSDPKPVEPGGDLIYYLTVTNLGPATAANVTLTDPMPTDLTGVQYEVSGSGTGYSAWPADNVVSLGALDASESKTIWVRGQVAETPAEDMLVNTVQVSTDTSDPVPGNNTYIDQVRVLDPAPQCDLSLVTSVDHETALPGDTLVFTLTVANHGPGQPAGVQVSNRLPHGLVYASDDGSGTYDSRTGIWSLNELPTLTSQTLHVTVRVSDQGAITNTAFITGGGYRDTNPANNSSTLTVNGTSGPDMALWARLRDLSTSDWDSALLDNGDQFDLTIYFESNGTATADGVQVQVSLPAGVAVNGAVPGTGCFDAASNIWHVDDSLACTTSLGDGADPVQNATSATLEMTLEVIDAAAIGAGLVTAEIMGASSDPDMTNNTISKTLVQGDTLAVDLAVNVAANLTTIGSYQTAVITVTVRNNGPDAASGIKLLSQLPLELTLLSAYPSQGTYRRDSGIWLVDLLPANAIAALELTVVPAAGTETALFAAEVSDVAENDIYTGNNRRQIQLQVNQGGSGEGGGCFLDNLLDR